MLGAGSIYGCASAFGEGFGEFLDRTRLVSIVVVLGTEHLQEGPLGPFIVVRVAGSDLTAQS